MLAYRREQSHPALSIKNCNTSYHLLVRAKTFQPQPQAQQQQQCLAAAAVAAPAPSTSGSTSSWHIQIMCIFDHMLTALSTGVHLKDWRASAVDAHRRHAARLFSVKYNVLLLVSTG
jgi:hypothetical protein